MRYTPSVKLANLERLLIAIAATGGALGPEACAPKGSCDGFQSTPYTRDVTPEAGVVTQAPGSALTPSECASICPVESGSLDSCKSIAGEAGTAVECTYHALCEGRRPAGLVSSSPARSDDAVGAFFAHVAHLEAASVTAFRVLARELRVLSAPRTLIRSARRAAREERRHARATRALAHGRGARVCDVRLRPTPPRSLEAIAFENMVEGCVRETWGALLATYQAIHARDPRVRATMKRIARDETRHATLAWSIRRWSERRLSREARSTIDRARDAAIGELRASLRCSARSVTLENARLIPDRARMLALFDALFHRLH
jgi:hypothetical protein